jgi:hypothetical protein
LAEHPTAVEVRKALVAWKGSTGLQMTNVRVYAEQTKRFGKHLYCLTDFVEDGEEVGRFRVRYCESGEVHLDHVWMREDAQAGGRMTELLGDFLPFYRRWGLDRVTMDALVPPGEAFAASAGMTKVGDGPTWEMAVPEGPIA